MQTSTIRAIAHALPQKTSAYEEMVLRFGERQAASIYKMSGFAIGGWSSRASALGLASGGGPSADLAYRR